MTIPPTKIEKALPLMGQSVVKKVDNGPSSNGAPYHSPVHLLQMSGAWGIAHGHRHNADVAE